MLSQAIRRTTRVRSLPRSLTSLNFSTAAVSDDKKEESGGFFSNLSPLYAIPTGIILGIPIIQNEVLILNEETQLVACFAAFVITAYTKGGDAIAASLDEKAAAIQREHNLIEDAQINAVQAVIDGHKKRLTLAADLESLAAQTEATVKAANAAAGHKLRHVKRDDVERQLTAVHLKE